MVEIEHVANALCLELANSVNNRQDPTLDWLADPEAFAVWIASLGLEPAGVAGPAELARVVDLREAIFRTFQAVAGGVDSVQADLEAITRIHAQGFATHSLVRDGTGFRRAWPAGTTAEELAFRAASSAVDLLTGTALARVKSCPSCEWLFLDTSKNGTRRWCSMAMCGSRIKAKRHYDRSRAVAS